LLIRGSIVTFKEAFVVASFPSFVSIEEASYPSCFDQVASFLEEAFLVSSSFQVGSIAS
jgi:hypothetical protein